MPSLAVSEALLFPSASARGVFLRVGRVLRDAASRTTRLSDSFLWHDSRLRILFVRRHDISQGGRTWT